MESTTDMTTNHQALFELSQNTIYLMGGSFILGSLFTIFLLLVLDLMRARKQARDDK